jgi:hypothetical protein
MTAKIAKNSEHPNLNVGRKAGAINKTTAVARQAFANLVEGNAPKMQDWLYKVAEGIPLMEKVTENEVTFERQVIRNGVPIWVVVPAPDKALDIMQKMAEYHIPKLARTEHIGSDDKPIRYVVSWKK